MAIEAPETLRYLHGFWDEYAPYYLKAVLLFPASTSRGDLYPPLVVGWTLIYEMLFYLVFSAAMLAPRRWALPIISGALIGLVAIGSTLPHRSDAGQFLGNPIYLEFLLGMAVGQVFVSDRLTIRGAWLITAAAVLGLSVMFFAGERFRALYYGIPAAAVLTWSLAAPASRGLLGWGLARLGDASYPLYLSHGIVLMALGRLIQEHTVSFPSSLGVPALLVGSVAAAFVLHFAVERPLIALGAAARRLPAFAAPRPSAR